MLCAKDLVGNEAFAVLLADGDLMVGKAARDGADGAANSPNGAPAYWRLQDVPREHTRRYGIVSGTLINDCLTDVTGIVETGAGGRTDHAGGGGPLHP